jgi:hypothetical protein
MILAESSLKGNTICYSLDNTADVSLFVWILARTNDTTSRLYIPCTNYRVLIDPSVQQGVVLDTSSFLHLRVAH